MQHQIVTEMMSTSQTEQVLDFQLFSYKTIIVALSRPHPVDQSNIPCIPINYVH